MELYDLAKELENGLPKPVLVTVYDTEGHAYRKPGACMIMTGDGRMLGSVSPGCLESDLLEHAAMAWEQNRPQMVEYETREERDWLWAETVGCGGAVRLLLEPVRDKLLECIMRLKRLLDQESTVRFVRRVSRINCRIRYRLQVMTGTPSEGNMSLVNGRKQSFWLIGEYAPHPRLFVFGAGNDAQPLVRLAPKIGFRPFVIDWRTGLCTRSRFPEAESLIDLSERSMDSIGLQERDYVVVMSHHLQRDRDFLQSIADCRLHYVGIMGSAKRTERLLEGVRPPEWFRYPIGLDIGADGPDEIAVAITAELLSRRRGGSSRKGGDAREA